MFYKSFDSHSESELNIFVTFWSVVYWIQYLFDQAVGCEILGPILEEFFSPCGFHCSQLNKSSRLVSHMCVVGPSVHNTFIKF